MALDKEKLKNNLARRFNAIDPRGGNVAGKVAKIIADEVDAYIRSQTITVSTTVSGTCSNSSGVGGIAGSGIGNGTVS